MNRRHWLLGGVAAGGALAGAGLAWRRTRDDAAADPLWAMRFTQPGGGELAMAALRGKPLLLNFWATWCAPCVKEMPLLDAFFKQHRAAGWQVLGLAIDSPTPVREFLSRLPMSFPIGLAGMDGAALTRDLGNPSGALPFSVLFDRQARVVERKLGQIAPADLSRWLEAVA